jgi:hypothetical protein
MRTYYRTRMNANNIQIQRGRKPQAPERPVTWSAETVWAAAAYAYRINGRQYLKSHEYRVDSQGRVTNDLIRSRNRDVMNQALRDLSMITEEDRLLGNRARDWLGKDILMKTLKGALTEFETSCQRVVAQEEFDEWTTRYELALVPSQISAYEQAIQLETAMAGLDRTPVAAVGEKVETNIRVIKTVYSQNYGVYFVTGLTPDCRAVFFSYRDRLGVGHQCRIRGTVKAHRENSTQLNRVRIS